jgi:hypothetical protein
MTPDRLARESYGVHKIDRTIGNAVLGYPVPVRLQHGNLGRNALVFTPTLLVEVMRYQDIHRQREHQESVEIGIVARFS